MLCFLVSGSTIFAPTTLFPQKSNLLLIFNLKVRFLQAHFPKPFNISMAQSLTSALAPLKCSTSIGMEIQKLIFDPHSIHSQLVQEMAYDALVWSSLHGLLVGDRNSQRSGIVPGVGLVHAPISLLPMTFPESHWKQACEVAPIFNELIDRVSLDGRVLVVRLIVFLNIKPVFFVTYTIEWRTERVRKRFGTGRPRRRGN